VTETADDWSGPETVLDFQIGGREHHHSMMAGRLHTFESRFWDIVPDERIVFAYDMQVDEEIVPSRVPPQCPYLTLPGLATHAAGWPVALATVSKSRS
jgi:uncharacterized protein YndB with AHSA1/START domain